MMDKLWQAALKLLSGRKTIMTTLAGTGSYVAYTDSQRYNEMVHRIKQGKILIPVDSTDNTASYQSRPSIEQQLRHILGPQFSNQYYLIKGEVGSGKSRTIVELVKSMMRLSEGRGAPIYVLVTQQKEFANTLGTAVNFKFDEHVNFQFYLQYLMQINKFPPKDSRNKLDRVLNAIEYAAYSYMHKEGRPMVLIIDGADTLTTNSPGTIQKLQEKAKLWADQNICKVVFVSTEDETENVLKMNSSCWSRAGEPIYVGDLTKEETLLHLLNPQLLQGKSIDSPSMDTDRAAKIHDLVGGRIHYLNIFKQDYHLGIPFEETANSMKTKEREKFVRISRVPKNWQAIDIVRKSPAMTIYLSNLLKSTTIEYVDNLVRENVLKLITCDSGIKVKFESRLTENTVEEMYTKYNAKS